jgi:hypothetical protein
MGSGKKLRYPKVRYLALNFVYLGGGPIRCASRRRCSSAAYLMPFDFTLDGGEAVVHLVDSTHQEAEKNLSSLRYIKLADWEKVECYNRGGVYIFSSNQLQLNFAPLPNFLTCASPSARNSGSSRL